MSPRSARPVGRPGLRSAPGGRGQGGREAFAPPPPARPPPASPPDTRSSLPLPPPGWRWTRPLPAAAGSCARASLRTAVPEEPRAGRVGTRAGCRRSGGPLASLSPGPRGGRGGTRRGFSCAACLARPARPAASWELEGRGRAWLCPRPAGSWTGAVWDAEAGPGGF